MLTTVEPLKSALSTAGADDTSLAVPTDDTLRSGQRRVLDQVLSVKRSKSKHGRSGTMSARTLSPTSRKHLSMRTRYESCLFLLICLQREPVLDIMSGHLYGKHWLRKLQKLRSCSDKPSVRNIVFERLLGSVLRKVAMRV